VQASDNSGSGKPLSVLEMKKRAQNTKLATLIKEAVQDKKRFSQFFETLQASANNILTTLL
jgi:hypothetical protein